MTEHDWFTLVPMQKEANTIGDFARTYDLHLTVTQQGPHRWTASFDSIEVKDGPVLWSAYGDAATPFDAVRDYIIKIAGCRLVFDAQVPETRREFYCWRTLIVEGI